MLPRSNSQHAELKRTLDLLRDCLGYYIDTLTALSIDEKSIKRHVNVLYRGMILECAEWDIEGFSKATETCISFHTLWAEIRNVVLDIKKNMRDRRKLSYRFALNTRCQKAIATCAILLSRLETRFWTLVQLKASEERALKKLEIHISMIKLECVTRIASVDPHWLSILRNNNADQLCELFSRIEARAATQALERGEREQSTDSYVHTIRVRKAEEFDAPADPNKACTACKGLSEGYRKTKLYLIGLKWEQWLREGSLQDSSMAPWETAGTLCA